MKHKLLTIAACLIVALSLSACAGMGGGSGIPSTGNGITDIGNPNEDAELVATKGIYINQEFEVRIDYPLRWELEERNTHEAYFHSDKAEAITASFVELEDGENLESFLTEVRGGSSDLTERNHPDFDRSLCADNAIVGGMIAIECYYYRTDGDFVMVFTGMSLSTNDAPSVGEFTVVTGKASSTEESGMTQVGLIEEDDEAEEEGEGITKTIKYYGPKKLNLRPIEDSETTVHDPFPPIKNGRSEFESSFPGLPTYGL
jgi:hypothetical protein